MKILVTGARGFLGRHVLDYISQKYPSSKIVALTSSEKLPESSKYDWRRCDLHDLSSVTMMMEEVEPTHMIHLAWYVEHGQFWSSLESFKWVCSSLHLMKEFYAHGGRKAVFAGTCAEYSWSGDEKLSEGSNELPQSFYGQQKLHLCKLIESYANRLNLDWAWGRIFFLYGQGEPSTRLIPSLIDEFRQGRSVELTDCEQLRDFLPVEFVADGFVQLLMSENSRGVYNIASSHPLKLRRAVEVIHGAIGAGTPLYGHKKRSENDPATIVGCNEKILRDTSWSAPSDFEEHLRNFSLQPR